MVKPQTGQNVLFFPLPNFSIVNVIFGENGDFCVQHEFIFPIFAPLKIHSLMPKEKINKTNACRILDQKKVAYELIPYEVDENDLGAQHIADQLGEDINQVFKTLVLKGDKTGHFVCVIPGNDEVDLKKTSKVTGNKSCDLIPMKELLPLTGYVRGGCSPVGMKKPFPTFIHETCQLFDYIYVSAGVRGLQFKLNPQHLIDLVGMTVADLTA